jgi:hypothetical protein
MLFCTAYTYLRKSVNNVNTSLSHGTDAFLFTLNQYRIESFGRTLFFFVFNFKILVCKLVLCFTRVLCVTQCHQAKNNIFPYQQKYRISFQVLFFGPD